MSTTPLATGIQDTREDTSLQWYMQANLKLTTEMLKPLMTAGVVKAPTPLQPHVLQQQQVSLCMAKFV